MCTAHVEFSMHNITISKNVEFCKTLVELVVGGLAKKKTAAAATVNDKTRSYIFGRHRMNGSVY